MQQETKLQLRQVFDQFDIDKSGFVDIKEVKQISQQLGQELTDIQIDKLMKTVDQNNDNKISFDEFWYWWQYLKDDNLEKLVSSELKLLNLLKKTYAEFTRFGIPLDVKQDPLFDNHYFALNYGDFPGHFKLESKFIMKGSDIDAEIQQQNQGDINLIKSPSPQVYLYIQCSDPPKVKDKLEEVIKQYKLKYTSARGNSPETSLILQFLQGMYCEIHIVACQSHILIHFPITFAMIDMALKMQFIPYIKKIGKDTEIVFDLNFRLKSGFTKMMRNDIPLVKYLVEGFMSELRFKINSGFMKAAFKLLNLELDKDKGFKQQLGVNYRKTLQDKNDLMQAFTFPLMLKSSKTHFQLRNVEDIESFLKQLGLAKLVEQQPSARDLLAEIFNPKEVSDFKNPDGPLSIFYNIIKIFSEYNTAIGSLYFIMPYCLFKLNFNMVGFKEVVEAFIQDDPISLQKKQQAEREYKKERQPKGKRG